MIATFKTLVDVVDGPNGEATRTNRRKLPTPRGQGYAPPHSGGFGVSLDRDGRRWIVIEFSAILLT